MNLKNLKKGKVIVFGDVILDKYIMGSIDRISPEAPVPVLRPSNEEIRLGGAANVALNLSSLGIKATLIGVTGKDGDSRVVNELLKKNKIKIALRKSLHPTISKTRLLSAQQQILRIDEEENFPEEDWKFTLELFYKHISLNDVSALVLSDYGKGTLKDTALLIKKAKAKGKIVLVDPKGKDFSKYKGADIITPNFSEFEDVVGRVGSEAGLTKKGKALIKALNLNALLITRGPEGMTLLQNKKGKVLRSDFPTQARDVFDVSGAGDTVIAALAGGLAGGFDLGDSIRMANIAAGIVVAKLGTATVTPQEINPFLEKEKPYLVLEEVGPYKDDLKDSNKKIVFTNGCFDLLHIGHVKYLEAAKSFGDILIRGLNSDRSVKAIKGSERPINNERDRAYIVAALEVVDYVVIFDEDTPYKLIQSIKPNTLVKGKDYEGKKVVGQDIVDELVLVEFVEGKSSSQIINKIQTR